MSAGYDFVSFLTGIIDCFAPSAKEMQESGLDSALLMESKH